MAYMYLVVGPACPLVAGTCCVKTGVGLPVWRSAGHGGVQKDPVSSPKSGIPLTLIHHAYLKTKIVLKGHVSLTGLWGAP